jgi:hypothetical protein
MERSKNILIVIYRMNIRIKGFMDYQNQNKVVIKIIRIFNTYGKYASTVIVLKKQ